MSGLLSPIREWLTTLWAYSWLIFGLAIGFLVDSVFTFDGLIQNFIVSAIILVVVATLFTVLEIRLAN